MKTHVLVVEDDVVWSNLVRNILKDEGYQVTVSESADEAMREISLSMPDLLILDVKLRGVGGTQLCQWLRADPPTAKLPILMLTALGKEQDRVQGLNSGADDYVVKPFSEKELVARVKALLRRAKPDQGLETQLSAHGIIVDTERHEVSVNGKPVTLRPKEFDILLLLMQRRGKVVSRRLLAEQVWGKDYEVTSQNIAQQIRNLREALGAAAELIETVETLGYKFRD